jgi:hypothetical protein
MLIAGYALSGDLYPARAVSGRVARVGFFGGWVALRCFPSFWPSGLLWDHQAGSRGAVLLNRGVLSVMPWLQHRQDELTRVALVYIRVPYFPLLLP